MRPTLSRAGIPADDHARHAARANPKRWRYSRGCTGGSVLALLADLADDEARLRGCASVAAGRCATPWLDTAGFGARFSAGAVVAGAAARSWRRGADRLNPQEWAIDGPAV